MKITNNQGLVMELDKKAIEILAIVYTVGDYKMQKKEYNKAEDKLIKDGYVLWEIFGGVLQPIPNLKVIQEILTQRDDGHDKVLDNLFKNGKDIKEMR